MKRFLFSLAVVILPLFSFAQDFAFDNVTAEELNMKRYDKDTTAHAVVLQEYGESKMSLGTDDYVKLFFAYHAKIKILDNQGFDEGTVTIPLSANENFKEILSGLSGFTEYTDNDGKVQKLKLDPGEIYKINKTSHSLDIKFAFPGLKKGCVIEYKFRIETPFYSRYRPWFFQADIPKVYSEYEVHIPAFWKYNAVIKGPLKLTKKNIDAEQRCFLEGGASSDCLHMVFGMSDIPAFIGEEFMTSPKNFLSAVYFEMIEDTNPFTGREFHYARNWADVDKEFKELESFGGQLKKADKLKNALTLLTMGKSTDLDKAREIYAFIKKSVKWNEEESPVSREGILKAIEAHTGNAADINIALVSSLNAVGLNAEPVLISTRDNGVVNQLFPTMDDFNYVIAKLNIGTQSYFLDATEPLLGFGVLPMRCLNGQGRVMSISKPSYWIDIDAGQKETTLITIDLTLQSDGKMKGNFIHYSSGYAAYLKREQIKKFNSLDEFVEAHQQPTTGRLHITKSEINNVDSLDKPLVETYEIEFDLKQNTGEDGKLMINPFTFDHVTNNPFKLAERSFPVDKGMPGERKYILTMHLPDNYVVEDALKPESMALPNQGGKFVSDFQQYDKMFVYSHITQFSRSVYWPAEYASLKEFYNRIIQSERQNIILKKEK